MPSPEWVKTLPFHQHGFKAPITIVSKEANAPIDR